MHFVVRLLGFVRHVRRPPGGRHEDVQAFDRRAFAARFLPGKSTERSSPRSVAPCRQEREGAHMPTVISVFNSSQFGIPDPSGLAYNPVAGGLFLVDSEVDETPFFSDTNMFSVNFDGSLQQSYAFTSVSTEPTEIGRAHV